MKIVIIGAGVTGLGIGWRLRQAGAEVTILERAGIAQGASWAAAGMLALTAEMAGAAAPELSFAMQSNDLWPDFAAEVEQASGQFIGYVASGALLVARDAAALATLQARAVPPLEILDRKAARRLAPLLAHGFVGALWSPREAHVDNRALGAALSAAFQAAGGILLPNEAVVKIERHGDAATAVLTSFGRYGADAFVIAAGAWSGLLDDIPVIPVKGEMIALAPPAGAHLPWLGAGPVVWGEGVYLVPRQDMLLVGATVEETGFDTGLTDTARDQLRTRALRLMPGLADWTVVDHWAGLRPKSPDGLPLLGPIRVPNLFVASGQYRNGILFAPAIAGHMADLVLGRSAPIPEFDPRRFA